MSEPTDDELRRLAGEATPGPWTAAESQFDAPRYEVLGPKRQYGGLTQWPVAIGNAERCDAAYIVAAANALPGLLDRIDQRDRDVRDAHARIDAIARDWAASTEKCAAVEAGLARLREAWPRCERHEESLAVTISELGPVLCQQCVGEGVESLWSTAADALHALDVASRDGVDPVGEARTKEDKEQGR